MTCVAYKDGILAGDRQGNGSFLQTVEKIFRLPDGRRFGGSGAAEQVREVRDWLAEGGDKPADLDNFNGILIDGPRVYRLECRLILVPILEPFYAIGSGACYAITAMALGQSAEQAVEIAARFDPDTGGGVEVLAGL